MNYQWYEKDIEDAWKNLLFPTFSTVSKDVFKHTGKSLTPPNFKVNPNLNHLWARWIKNERTIEFSSNLLRNFEWAAVEHVMRHEVAHQIVDEIFNIPYGSHPHGEAWERACLIVGIPPNRTDSHLTLSEFKSSTVSPTIEKIRKLIIHGNDSAVTEAESQLFLTKAQELMLKHNIDASTLHNTPNNKLFCFRPVGPLLDGSRAWIGYLVSIITEFYNVKAINLYYGLERRRFEFYGTPTNLDIAEYVFHALLTQAESLYNQFKSEHQTKFKEDENYRKCQGQSYNGNSKRISKKAFMLGLYRGYTAKLRQTKSTIMSTVTPQDCAIIAANDGMLEQAFDNHYHPRNISYGRSQGRGESEGRAAGASLSIAKGVSNSTSRSLALNA